SVFHAHYVDRSLWADRSTLSASAGGAVNFDLLAGSAQAGNIYLVLGSFTGTTPGFTVAGIRVPLNQDFFTDFTATNANSPMLVNTIGLLLPGGTAGASFVLPAGLAPPALAGLYLDFGYLVADP